jgi:DNA recombination protein RmuC
MAEQTRQHEENLKRFEGARAQMTDEFKAIAGDVLKSHGETFSRQNREQVDILLKPLQEKIVEFHTGLIRDRSEMSERIRALAESNAQITTEAHNLTRALKGNSQTQGAWGEMILSTILERSGLREGEQFLTQQTHSGDDRSRLRTDVEIMMPNEDRIVIDSKVSLTAFEAYVNCADDEERQRHLGAHLTSMRGHIKTLGEKNYQRHAKSSLDYVMMFVPIEAALSAAVTADPRLFEYGMSRGVMLTTPTTLMTVLRTIRNVWDIEKRHQNAEEIAERAGSLYEKVVGFLGNMDKLGTSLDRAQQSFVAAKNQLSDGPGNVLRQVDMLRELGAKTTKTLPKGWDGSGETPPVPRAISSETAVEDIETFDFDEPQARLAGE